MKAVVSEKGQVTIPKSLRDRLGIEPGQELDFSEERGRLIASKVRDRRPIDEVYGILAVPDGTDAMLDELRGTPDLR